jgi:hypothetical protein
MRRVYQYQTDCFRRADDFDQPQRGSWVIQRLVNGYWRNYLWPFHSREAAEKALRELDS